MQEKAARSLGLLSFAFALWRRQKPGPRGARAEIASAEGKILLPNVDEARAPIDAIDTIASPGLHDCAFISKPSTTLFFGPTKGGSEKYDHGLQAGIYSDLHFCPAAQQVVVNARKPDGVRRVDLLGGNALRYVIEVEKNSSRTIVSHHTLDPKKRRHTRATRDRLYMMQTR